MSENIETGCGRSICPWLRGAVDRYFIARTRSTPPVLDLHGRMYMRTFWWQTLYILV